MKKFFSFLLYGAVIMSFGACDLLELFNESDNNPTTEEKDDPSKGHEYVDLYLPSGTLWATCNVGATNPEDYGDYFAWGETQPKSNYDWSNAGDYKWGVINWDDETNQGMTKYNKIDNKTVLEAADDAATANWGGVWRMPTKAEQDELRRECIWTWTTLNDVNGYRVISKKDTTKSIFLPAVGFYYGSDFGYAGTLGDYLNSSTYVSYPCNTYNLCFDSAGHYMGNSYRCYGYSVRPVCSPR